ncbi:nuclear transport factor 2 family protein [Gaopeijia maritima]|uniref:nuclear transport factor 2 family protein n=1 Tax=Gaopeijia maritima TaxID=3119007 RepID=UPI0032469B8D
MKGLLSVVGLLSGVALLYAWGPPGPAEAAWTSADEEAVREAVLDYVEGVYEVAPERIDRSVHPSLHKLGFLRRPDGSWGTAPMDFEQLRALAGQWNADGHVGDDGRKEVTVLDVLDQTASAKLVAEWGVDYFHLARVDGRWQILNVLWQTPPADG